MRFKYYLRGAGLGILLATLVLTITFLASDRKVSDEEVIRRAQELGMLMPGQDADQHQNLENIVPDTSETDTENTVPSAENGTGQDEETLNTENAAGEEQAETAEYYLLEIERGDTARIIGQKLQDAGVITDGEAFRKYLGNSGQDQVIKTGWYQIPYGLSFSEMIEILSAGPMDPALVQKPQTEEPQTEEPQAENE